MILVASELCFLGEKIPPRLVGPVAGVPKFATSSSHSGCAHTHEKVLAIGLFLKYNINGVTIFNPLKVRGTYAKSRSMNDCILESNSMSDSIFSTYKAGENRITASILAVLRSLSLTRCEQILAALLEQSEFELIRFQNQPSRDGEGIPDAEIVSSCRLLIETKTKPNAVKVNQLERHLKRFDNSDERTKRLLVLTPDTKQPPQINKVKDLRLMWASFASLNQAIDELFEDKKEVISEREAFLLRELQTMLDNEELIGPSKDTLVIPARHAWPEYKEFYAYVCQANRSFKNVTHLAFYYGNKIHEFVPKILDSEESIEMRKGLHSGELGKLVDYLLGKKLREEGKTYKVVFLSPPDSPETVHLDKPVINDLVSARGVTTAFAQNQRYVELDALKKARKTSELC